MQWMGFRQQLTPDLPAVHRPLASHTGTRAHAADNGGRSRAPLVDLLEDGADYHRGSRHVNGRANLLCPSARRMERPVATIRAPRAGRSTMASYEVLDIERNEHVATLWLANPD
jgi:hypothetical protein